MPKHLLSIQLGATKPAENTGLTAATLQIFGVMPPLAGSYTKGAFYGRGKKTWFADLEELVTETRAKKGLLGYLATDMSHIR